MAAAVQEVDRAFSQYHTSLERLRERGRTDALRADLTTADNTLKQLRQTAVQQIHATSTCAKSEDEEKDNEDEDNDSEHDATSSASPSATPSPTPTSSPSASPSASASPLVTGNDAQSIADSAVAAMKLVFDTVSAELPAPSASAHPDRTFGSDHRDGRGGRD